MISIYCDGSSSGKSDKPGGWAYVIVEDGNRIIKCGNGGDPSTTNNKMELLAAINGIKKFIELGLKGKEVELVSDSEYTLRIASGIYTPTKNIDLCNEIGRLFKEINASTRWVKGHSNDFFNSKCDSLAKMAKENIKALSETQK